MKALFIGGAVSSLSGLAMGMGMALPPEPTPTGADVQPVAQLFASNESMQSASYDVSPDSLPPAYVVDTAYTPGPIYDLRPEVEVQPVADVHYDDDKAIDRVLKNAWTDTAEPEARPQDVAAAGDTRQASDAPDETRTYASIDAVLTAASRDKQSQAEPGV